MCAKQISTDHDRLFAIAESQQGYFTMSQALGAGFATNTHCFHVKSGNWIREHRGIYRLRRFPTTDQGQMVLWSLWSRDRAGICQGVYSHATALALRDLSDLNPSKLHMTVPPRFRRNSLIPPVLILHKAVLAPNEIVREHGYAITTPMRAILDVAEEGETDDDVLRQALADGLRRGLITRNELKRTRERGDLPLRLSPILGEF